jgi:DNA-binding IclR family transcriptional regulator
MSTETYKGGEQTDRVCRLILLLAGNTVNGLSPGEIAKGLDTHPSNVTRLIAHLKRSRFVEEHPLGGRWRLGAKVVQIALAHMSDVRRAEEDLNDIRNRYSRKA